MNSKRSVPKEWCLEIGERLRKQRAERGLSQKAVADYLDVTPQHYGDVERGQHCFSVVQYIKLYNEYEMDIGYILTGDRRKFLSELYKDCPQDKVENFERIIELACTLYRSDS